MQSASARISAARTHLILDQPWYGSLAMRLDIREDSQCETMRTDGTKLEYSPSFVDGLSDAELRGVLAHEVLHCALLHPYRCGSRDLSEWNEACDYAINQLLIDAGFILPAGALLDSQYSSLSADAIYAKRKAGKQPQQSGSGQGQGQQPQPTSNGQPSANGQPQPGTGSAATGSFCAAPQPDASQPGSEQPDQMTATDWEIAVSQVSAISEKAGTLPGESARAAKAARDSQADWRDILARFVEHTRPYDFTYARPNRRFIADGLILPGVYRQNVPRLAVAIDTSGSITAGQLAIFASELRSILADVQPELIEVIYCDSRVQSTESFSPEDISLHLSAVGGGGTRFRPVFEHLAKSDELPAALIYFTDLESSDTPTQPDYPVLWVVPEWSRRKAPFGEMVKLRQWG